MTARTALQQPKYDDPSMLAAVVEDLSSRQPLVEPDTIDRLLAKLARVADGEAFVLQAGYCAETFRTSQRGFVRLIKVIFQMALILMHGSGVEVIKILRGAGQFGKPRSSAIGSDGLPVFRGDIINGAGATQKARRHDPKRLTRAYNESRRILEMLQAVATGELGSLRRIHTWNQQFVATSPQGMSYEDLASAIDDALAFMEACGIDLSRLGSLDVAEVFSSHEALVLVYEEALVRGLYDCSGHFLWIGERTRGLLDAHIEFFRHLVGPVGVKLGPTTTPKEVKQYCQILNRKNIPGRLTFISRMGADNVRSVLPGLMKAAREIGCPVVWICDPMHGNTFMAGGFKTRDVRVIKSEIAGFFAAAADAGEWPGGLHLELTGDPVTECIGGHEEVTASDLPLRYTTACDPRLNALQGIEIAFFTARLLRQLRRAHSRR